MSVRKEMVHAAMGMVKFCTVFMKFGKGGI